MEHYLSSSADLSPSRFKVCRLVVEFVMASLTVQELVIRSFVKPADCFACSFYGVQEETSQFLQGYSENHRSYLPMTT